MAPSGTGPLVLQVLAVLEDASTEAVGLVRMT